MVLICIPLLTNVVDILYVGLPFPSPVDHILSELSTKIHLSWVALHNMAHSFTELDMALIQVINLVSFL